MVSGRFVYYFSRNYTTETRLVHSGQTLSGPMGARAVVFIAAEVYLRWSEACNFILWVCARIPTKLVGRSLTLLDKKCACARNVSTVEGGTVHCGIGILIV